MAAPKYIHEKVNRLQKALIQVANLTDDIIQWCDDKNVDGLDIACEYQIDNPYEFDLKGLHEELDTIADSNYEPAENSDGF